jgi:hypothetical protein
MKVASKLWLSGINVVPSHTSVIQRHTNRLTRDTELTVALTLGLALFGVVLIYGTLFTADTDNW